MSQPTRLTPHALNIALFSVHGDPLLPTGSEEAGGQNVYVREVARALAARGHVIDVFTRGRDCDDIEVHPTAGYRVIRVPAGPRGFLSRNHLFPHLPEFVERVERWGLAEGGRYDVLHSNYWISGWVGMQLAARWGLLQTHTHHSLGAVKFAAEGKLPAQGQVRLGVEARLIRDTSIIATSPQELLTMRRHYPPPRQVTVVPCGIDETVFHPRHQRLARHDLGLPLDGALLAYAGRFDHNKGIDCLVKAFARLRHLPNVHLAIAGGFDPQAADHGEYQHILDLVEELGVSDRTTFLGKLEPSRLARLYAAADLCVVPSHYESFGLVAIESMGCGTPVVASEVGGLVYTVRHGETGWLVPPRDIEALASACERLLRNHEERRKLGRTALMRVQASFTWSAVAQLLEEHYTSLRAPRTRKVAR